MDEKHKPAAEKIMPQYKFEEFFGHEPEKYFNAQRIAAAEKTFTSALRDLEAEALLQMQQAVDAMAAHSRQIFVDQNSDGAIEQLYTQAFLIKCHAGMYGFPLATAFANQLFYYAHGIAGVPCTANSIKSINAHIEALRVIFRKNIRSMTDPVGMELLKELERLGKV